MNKSFVLRTQHLEEGKPRTLDCIAYGSCIREAVRRAIVDGRLPINTHLNKDRKPTAIYWAPRYGNLSVTEPAPFIYGGYLLYAFIGILRFPVVVHATELNEKAAGF